MPDYKVTWEIELEAASPLEATMEAQRIQRDPASTATFFKVRSLGTPPSADLEYELPPFVDDNKLWLFRDRLVGLVNFSYKDFAELLYDKPCPHLPHTEEYLRQKYDKFQADPLGALLALDSRGFGRVYEFLQS